MTALEGLRETTLPGQTLFARGKVRDLYAVGHDRLLIVATDRISAFDAVLPTPIPDKGKVLNLLSAFWFRRTRRRFLTTSSAPTPPPTPQTSRRTRRPWPGGACWCAYAADRRGVCRPGLPRRIGLERVPARRHRLRDPPSRPGCGERGPPGADLHPGDQGPERARREHPFRAPGAAWWGRTWPGACAGPPWTSTPRPRAVRPQRGIIIADTKMEFGLLPNRTARRQRAVRQRDPAADRRAADPGPSRFWEAATYEVGAAPPSYDKQYVRDYLEGSGWNKEPPAPALPPEVVAQTRQRYVDALRRLTGSDAL